MSSFSSWSGPTSFPTSVCLMFVSRLCCPKAVWVPVRKRRAKATPFQNPAHQAIPSRDPHRGAMSSPNATKPTLASGIHSVSPGKNPGLSTAWWNYRTVHVDDASWSLYGLICFILSVRELPLRSVSVGTARPSFLPLPFRINRPPEKRNVNRTYGERAAPGGMGGSAAKESKFLDLKRSSSND